MQIQAISDNSNVGVVALQTAEESGSKAPSCTTPMENSHAPLLADEARSALNKCTNIFSNKTK
jgi:hypothetical protein